MGSILACISDDIFYVLHNFLPPTIFSVFCCVIHGILFFFVLLAPTRAVTDLETTMTKLQELLDNMTRLRESFLDKLTTTPPTPSLKQNTQDNSHTETSLSSASSLLTDIAIPGTQATATRVFETWM